MTPDGKKIPNDNIVRLVDIRKTYVSGNLRVPVLKGIDATVRRGEFVGFIGTSGSGKSTLLNILGMLDVPTRGQYYLEGIEVGGLSDMEQATIRNRKIGFIFQSFNLFSHLSVEQNIEVPMVYGQVPTKIRRKRSLDLIARVGLGHRLGHRPTQLSGGECQRIAIARALSNNPAFILADEPTGNLDEKTSDEIMKLFHELNRRQGVTIVMVTHNPAFGPHYDKIIRLRDGKIDDTPFEWEIEQEAHRAEAERKEAEQ
ncbi:MAG: ABC transporter ATP-binding protein [Victivallales bacterium]|nr:ABC transporter ATP-binding protein [Victivallales bacterium]